MLKAYSDRGELGSDELTVELWEQHMACLVQEGMYFPDEQLVLLDGIPRTVRQTELMNGKINVKAILLFDVPDREVLIRRLSERAHKEGRDDDADPEVLRTRQKVYDEKTVGVVAHYPQELIYRINADQRPLEVLRDILNSVGDVLSEKFRLA